MRFSTINDIDYSNNPSRVVLNNIELPNDVIIGINGDKVIAESKILDGVAVYERICRKPFEINFEFTCRELSEKSDEKGKYIFPQSVIKKLTETVWQPDQVIWVENTLLNTLGINYLVLQPITFTTIRGNTNVLCSIKAKEAVQNYGETLIIL
jgi:hypothetical protein